MAQEGTYLKIQVAGYTAGFREKLATNDASLADAITGPDSSASVKVQYGSATVSLRLNARTDSGEDTSNVNGSWQDEFTVNNPALTGQQGIARFTVHLSGGLSGSWGGDAANGLAQYNALVGAISGGFFASGYLGSQNLHGEQVPATSTVDAFFTYGLPSTTPRFLLSAQVDGSGGFVDHEGSAVESIDFRLRSARFVVIKVQNQSVDFTATSNTGSAHVRTIPASSSLGGFTLTNTASGRLGTSLSLIDGMTSSAKTVQVAFVAPPPPADIKLVSDAVEVAGTGSDLFVI